MCYHSEKSGIAQAHGLGTAPYGTRRDASKARFLCEMICSLFLTPPVQHPRKGHQSIRSALTPVGGGESQQDSAKSGLFTFYKAHPFQALPLSTSTSVLRRPGDSCSKSLITPSFRRNGQITTTSGFRLSSCKLGYSAYRLSQPDKDYIDRSSRRRGIQSSLQRHSPNIK